MDQNDEEGDVLGLSFIDVLSCSLGGAIFLFLIFAVMPHFQERGGTADSGTGAYGTALQAGLPLPGDPAKVMTVMIQVTLSHPTRSLGINARNHAWEGLPEEITPYFESRGDGKEARFFALFHLDDDQGWEAAPITLTTPSLPDRTEVTAELFRGGEAQHTCRFQLTAPLGSETGLLIIDPAAAKQPLLPLGGQVSGGAYSLLSANDSSCVKTPGNP